MLATAPYKIFEHPDKGSFERLAEAAQEAEFLHVKHGKTIRVQDASNEIVYTSKGAPD
jgi:hypothetical protein